MPAGRPKGSKDKLSQSVRALAAKYTPMCLEGLANIAMRSKVEANRITAMKELLDRAHGKPTQSVGTDPEQPMEIVVRWAKKDEKLNASESD